MDLKYTFIGLAFHKLITFKSKRNVYIYGVKYEYTKLKVVTCNLHVYMKLHAQFTSLKNKILMVFALY